MEKLNRVQRNQQPSTTKINIKHAQFGRYHAYPVGIAFLTRVLSSVMVLCTLHPNTLRDNNALALDIITLLFQYHNTKF